MVAALPLCGKGAQSLPQLFAALRVFGEREGFFAGGFQKFAIAEGIGDVKTHFTGLAAGDKIARAPQLQNGFLQFSSLAGFYTWFNTRARRRFPARRRTDD